MTIFFIFINFSYNEWLKNTEKIKQLYPCAITIYLAFWSQNAKAYKTRVKALCQIVLIGALYLHWYYSPSLVLIAFIGAHCLHWCLLSSLVLIVFIGAYCLHWCSLPSLLRAPMKECARTKFFGYLLKLRTNEKRTNKNCTNQGPGVLCNCKLIEVILSTFSTKNLHVKYIIQIFVKFLGQRWFKWIKFSSAFEKKLPLKSYQFFYSDSKFPMLRVNKCRRWETLWLGYVCCEIVDPRQHSIYTRENYILEPLLCLQQDIFSAESFCSSKN